MARPRKTLSAEQCSKLRDLAATGHSQAMIARELGLDTKTLRRVLKDDPRAGEALDEGRGLEEGKLVHILMAAAESGRDSAAMFLLKARHGYRDRGEDPVANQGGVTVQIALPGPMSPDAYMRLVEGTVKQAIPAPAEGVDA